MMMQLGGTTTAAAAAIAAAQQTSDAAATATSTATASAVAGPLEGTLEEMSDRGFGGNRWPRQETLALLKIRSDMDIAFRDSSVKGPLWDEVSRKMLVLGYNRSAKKCKEKFENVYKYHKRTKDGRTGKSEGKTYRFFDQLEALEHHQSQPQPQTQTQIPLPPRPYNHNSNNSVFSATPPQQPTAADSPHPGVAFTTVTSTMPPLPNATAAFTQPVPANPITFSGDFMSESESSSSSTSSDVEISGGTRKKRKRKWKDFFERLMKQVVEKQEELQRRFLEAVEKREHERMVRDEAWRMQEMARINREREILAQELSMAAAKDAAVMTFLQKLSENPSLAQSIPHIPPQQTHTPRPPQPQTHAPQPAAAPAAMETQKTDNGDQGFVAQSSSRWPKVEIEALIKLRTNLDCKYQENGPKGPLWEEISAGMRRLGFNRSSKRCKEKWENINKYFKKVKESNKKRPEDSKTCPYFNQLDALYRERSGNNKFNSFADQNVAASASSTSTSTGQMMTTMKPENAVPLMVQPEQQWPPATQMQTQTQAQREDMDQDEEDDERERDFEGDEEDEDNEDDEDDGDGGEFEIVPNNNNNKGVSLGTSG